MKKTKLTYFTPTYNREKLLPNLYNSLLNQTDKNFIWLIIDDGSSDKTEELVKSWQNENKINIEYIKKPNGGKHTAIDLSNEVCKTEFICCIDSDDYLTNNATEVLYKYFPKIDDESIVGIVGRRVLYDGTNPNENNWPQENTVLFFNELSKVYNYNYDTILVFKTNIIKNYKFPVFADERFVTESVFYNQFMRKYKMLTISENVYLSEYQPDGYTQMGMNLFYKNPKGYAYALKQNAYLAIEDKSRFKDKLKKSILYYSWLRCNKIKTNSITDYKLPLFYRMVGGVTSLYFKRIYKHDK